MTTDNTNAAVAGAVVQRKVRRPRVQTLGRSPEAFNGRYKDCDIGVTRGASGNWYIVVVLESGMRSYDGYWRDSAHSSLDDAITEACTGATELTRNALLLAAEHCPVDRPVGPW